ncbi:MAG TPA: hypothetical protein VLK33_09285 [Terriglobales bacterium]|nr:hypothetical protein [Terriglobales bacterium]
MSADYIGHVAPQDIEEVMQQCLAQLDVHPCYFLIDTLPMTSIQPTFFKMGSLLKLINHPNNKWMVLVVADNPFMKFAVQVLVRNRAVTVVDTREKAQSFLTERLADEQKIAIAPEVA